MKSFYFRDFYECLDAKGLVIEYVSGSDVEITDLSFDTRDCRCGILFFCKGVHFIEKYLLDAKSSGAAAYISEKKYDCDLPYIIVSDIRRAMSLCGALFFAKYCENVELIGVTGTNGKTTTTYFIKNILDCRGAKESAILSSVRYYDGMIDEDAHLTTPEAISVFKHIKNASLSGIDYLEMECSSQALKYDRVSELRYKAAVFTNVDKEHISPNEHADFTDYYSSKLKIFDRTEIGVINMDDPYSDTTYEYASKKCRTVTFGYGSGNDYTIESYLIGASGISFMLNCRGKREEFRICMQGTFNIYNAAAAVAVCREIGIPFETIRNGLKNARVPGRMETFVSDDGRVSCIVDYAHNEFSYRKLCESAKVSFPGKKIVWVFGCAGNKAFDRRHDLPDVAGRNSDYVYITDDDSGEEGFDHIVETIRPNIDATGCPYSVIEDREEAVRRSILENGTDKIVLITGKGVETTQKHGTGYIPVMSDVEAAKKYINEYNEMMRGKS